MGEVFTVFWLGCLKGIDYWEDQSIGGRITLRQTFGRQGLIGKLDLAGSE